ncbi:hypothetical protein D6833_05665 [Candidatus Parcubacteria bacterium]|nr:MAG: hypothetical protein D6833_05665 [Candidatus Parcubacteria bacterium]
MLPFRSLILDQSQELPRIADIFGIPQSRFARIWGGSNESEIADAVKKEYLLVTPDKLLSLLVAGRRTSSAAALNLLSKYDFVFDEIHVYNAMMLTSLRYFLRSVRYWQELGQRKSGFYFLSATFPPAVWEMLQEELGLTEDDRIEGVSYTGDVKLRVRPVPTVIRTTEGEVPIAQDMEALDMETNTVGIFNSAYRAWQVCEAVGGLLFIGQDKMREDVRRSNFEMFRQSPEEYALIGSPAIEAGVDFVARNLVIEESHQDSFVQRFGRAARAGQDAFVLAYSDTLHGMLQKGFLASHYTRAAFLRELKEAVPRREPRRLFTALAAYAYYKFWNDPGFPMDSQDRKLCQNLKDKGVENILAFRGLTPYTRYESGEAISFKTLFRKDIPVDRNTGKVRGAPHPIRYFTRPQRRPPVFAKVLKIADKEELADGSTVMLARVSFSSLGLGTHWVLLELSKPTGLDDWDDNIRLQIGRQEYGRRQNGGIGELLVRFYDVDA